VIIQRLDANCNHGRGSTNAGGEDCARRDTLYIDHRRPFLLVDVDFFQMKPILLGVE
jgi:hypothetical protein